MTTAPAPVAGGRPARDEPRRTGPAVVCLTPVKNEAWILDRFLACASLWADHIVVADQGSTDGSAEIARAHPKVTFVQNRSAGLDEWKRQQLLIGTARELEPGDRLLVALDADEILSANWMQSPEWRTLLAAPAGTIACFQRVEMPDLLRHATLAPWEWAWGFMDDGSPHAGTTIHSARVPLPAGAPRLSLRDVKVLHYASTDFARQRSRGRWYQCWEAINRPGRRAAEVFREYHDFELPAPPERRVPVDPRWLAGYERQGIDMTTTRRDGRYWWDDEVLDLLAAHGAARFRRTSIWRDDWAAIAAARGRAMPPGATRDPQGALDRLALSWLYRTQQRRGTLPVRVGDALLRVLGW